jgi:hypothetical protein
MDWCRAIKRRRGPEWARLAPTRKMSLLKPLLLLMMMMLPQGRVVDVVVDQGRLRDRHNSPRPCPCPCRLPLLDVLQFVHVGPWDTPKIVGLDYKLQQSLPREYIPYCTVVDIEIESPKRDCIRQAYFFMDTHDITIILNPLSSLGTCVLSIIYLVFLLHLRHVWQ